MRHFNLGSPSGPYGCGALDLLIDNRLSFKGTGPHRRLIARLFYPTDKSLEATLTKTNALYWNPSPHKEEWSWASAHPIETSSPPPSSSASGWEPIDDRLKRIHVTKPADSVSPFEYLKGLSSFAGLNGFVSAVVNASLKGERVSAVEEAPLLAAKKLLDDRATESSEGSRKESFPIVVFSHGLGANRGLYSAICADLASHGFVVVTPNHRDGSASCDAFFGEYTEYVSISTAQKDDETQNLRHEQVLYRAGDLRLCIDALEAIEAGQWQDEDLPERMKTERLRSVMDGMKGALDLDSIVAVGHSFGAATVCALVSARVFGQAPSPCPGDARVKAAVAMDLWAFPLKEDLLSAGCRVPTLFLNSYEFHWEENLTRLHELIASTWKNCGCESDADEDVYCPSITIADSKHQNHADLPLIRSFILRLLKTLLFSFSELVKEKVDVLKLEKDDSSIDPSHFNRFLVPEVRWLHHPEREQGAASQEEAEEINVGAARKKQEIVSTSKL